MPKCRLIINKSATNAIKKIKFYFILLLIKHSVERFFLRLNNSNDLFTAINE